MTIEDDGQRTCSRCEIRYYDANRTIVRSPICKNCVNQPESSKREDFSYTVITNKEIEDEMKKMPQFKTYGELERCGTPNSMET